MSKPVVKFRTYRQTARVGGKIYGVANLADPQIASVTMQEVIDYAKLHNYSAPTLEALLSQVISGVADLVARDGRPRNLSDLLKFEPVIKGTFSNMEESVTSAQKVIIRPRLLKEIRVKIDSDTFSWQNQNDTLSPEIRSVAPQSDVFSEVNLASVRAGIAAATAFGWTYAGTRLAPNGWDSSCKVEVLIKPRVSPVTGVDTLHFEHIDSAVDVGTTDVRHAGFFGYDGDGEATDNTLAIMPNVYSPARQYWWYDADGQATTQEGEYLPLSGDQIIFRLTRTVGSGDTFTAEKAYTL